jgi:hypothetical protein
LITIDTEGDNLWAQPRDITVKNLAFLPRFQTLCERYGFKPTYLTNWEAAVDKDYQAFALDVLARDQCEVGMHIHAWNSPPIAPLTDDDMLHQPYLTEYPAQTLRDKVAVMTDLLEDALGRKMLSHRGGRWAFDTVYARALVEHGYKVDCSVTPNVSWRRVPGAPNGAGGPDHSQAPERPYHFPLGASDAVEDAQLLEVPMTILKRRRTPPERWLRRALGKQIDRVLWMRPNGRNLPQLLEVVDATVAERRDYLEFTLHSSEFMASGSPTFRTEEDIERLYEHLEALFARVQAHFAGQTLSAFAERWVNARQVKTTGFATPSQEGRA